MTLDEALADTGLSPEQFNALHEAAGEAYKSCGCGGCRWSRVLATIKPEFMVQILSNLDAWREAQADFVKGIGSTRPHLSD